MACRSKRELFLPRLHSIQAVIKLSGVVFPPFERGIIWSTSNFAPAWGVLPQYWHVKSSRFNISNRTFQKGVPLRLCSRYLLLPLLRSLSFLSSSVNFVSPDFKPLGLSGSPAAICALLKLPKQFLYAFRDGKSGLLSSHSWDGVCPRISNARNNSLSKKYGSVFFRPLFNICTKYQALIYKSIDKSIYIVKNMLFMHQKPANVGWTTFGFLFF